MYSSLLLQFRKLSHLRTFVAMQEMSRFTRFGSQKKNCESWVPSQKNRISSTVHGCSQNHEFYSLCTETTAFGISKVPKFETEYPFSSSPGFLTNLGIIDVPTVPIGGFIYSGGTRENTSYCLFAEASYKA